MTQVFVIPGLGVDKRIFKKIDFSALDVTFIEWIEAKKNESLQEYALRLGENIPDEVILIGVSFGGMLAVEIAKTKQLKHLILISSAKTKNEIPSYYNDLVRIGLLKLVPAKLLKKSNFITYWFFGVRKAEEKALLREIFVDIDPVFLKWALNAIVNWQNIDLPENYLHVHGTKDKLLPLKNCKVNQTVENGGHFIVFTHAKELSIVMKSAFSN